MVNFGDYGAFIDHSLHISSGNSGPLGGLHFAVKDVFSVKGYKNTAGNPTWLEHAKRASENADAVDRLLTEGAALVGTTVTDELMYSLKGDNKHFPPTINPKAQNCYTGGSSSGSAVAVASHQTDFAMGTDTGGSVRVPSSYCGIFGMRPSHGRISMKGVIPLAPSFDTVSWMSGSADTLSKVGLSLLPNQPVHTYRHLFIFNKAFELVQDPDDFTDFTRLLRLIKERYKLQSVDLMQDHSFEELTECFRILQGREAWLSHGKWIQACHPDFGKDIAERFESASKIKEDEAYSQMLSLKREFTAEMRKLLGTDSMVLIPTTPGTAPERGGDFVTAEQLRSKTMKLTCLAGLSGVPQITAPFRQSKKPLGLSFISGYNTDRQLLSFVTEIGDLFSDH
ncbi:amidase [Sporolactobacillus vineae]|uniref:amidase n=1 Tax=Sporolactobacillus vineae TaxID=444463 RepID=UPI000289FA4D|nr:amidase [Sporolactobacillus vineae]